MFGADKMHLSPPPPPRLAQAAFRSKAVFLLLMIYYFMYTPSFVEALCWSLFRYALLNVLSNFAIILTRKREPGCFAFIVFLMFCYCKCPVALPRGAVGWSAVCDCGKCIP